ncbi:signal transduction histidine kinase/AmiR/NasT family two-component response regulator [Amaricoccus macauensis]|uniref:histidine kinase n=1 Tax=Amaricoccus macauensis TaxID=57001 RepID=A0A840SQ09_9RHOB|nr:signal transduction histidine kinase/AmiR/NasT family two-component response regulator [Amaricoccus macauensis]
MASWVWDFLSTTGFQSRGAILGQPDPFWLHLVAGATLAIFGLLIPAAVLLSVLRRSEGARRALPSILAVSLAAFGVTHLMSIWTLWMPGYGAEGVIKAGAVLSAIFVALMFLPAMPLRLLVSGPRPLDGGDDHFAGGPAGGGGVQLQTAEFNQEIERRVNERTASLMLANKGLREARALADEANRAKSAFLAAMSHEIRTPMNGVLGMLSLVRRDQLDPEQAHYFAVAEESAHGLLAVINDILDYSRLDAGAVTLDASVFSPARVLLKVAELLGESAARKGLRLDVEIGPGMPQEVVGDPQRLRQVLINLISNAIKFTERGGVSVRFDAAGPGRLACEVHDTGVGIAPEFLDCLFTRFAQSRDGARHGGSGLGLAICRALVELMDGEIAVESIPGEGSVFRFCIACREVSTLLPEPSRSVAPAETAVGDSVAHARVLVVEDNAVNQLLVAKLLTRAGHDATVIGDGEGALKLLRGRDFDVVLMDVQLPGMDGVSVTRAIRELTGAIRDVPVIALTANAMAGDRERYLAAGMDDYVAKPIAARELYAAIDRQMERKSLKALQRRFAPV